jgi:hypothetical protein
MTMASDVRCPHCGHDFSAGDDRAASRDIHPTSRETAPVREKDDNPYASPQFTTDASISESSGHVTSQPILDALGQTLPWVRFLAVLGFVVAGLSAFGGISLLIAVAGQGVPVGIGIGAGYLITAVFGVAGASYLFTYGSRIRDLQRSHEVRSLESALRAQKSFWKFLGILILVYLFAMLSFAVLPPLLFG